jgi:hypothetical protein
MAASLSVIQFEQEFTVVEYWPAINEANAETEEPALLS